MFRTILDVRSARRQGQTNARPVAVKYYSRKSQATRAHNGLRREKSAMYTAIYYPHIVIGDSEVLRSALLLWDALSSLSHRTFLP